VEGQRVGQVQRLASTAINMNQEPGNTTGAETGLTGRHTGLGKSIVTNKEFESFNSTACGIRGVIDTMHNQLSKLEDEIRADEASRMEYERTLMNLRIKRDELRKRADFCKQYVKNYDSDIGPFQRTYEENTKGIGTLYKNARVSHRKGIQSLINEFNYHPAFKKPGDTFTATPFDPRRL